MILSNNILLPKYEGVFAWNIWTVSTAILWSGTVMSTSVQRGQRTHSCSAHGMSSSRSPPYDRAAKINKYGEAKGQHAVVIKPEQVVLRIRRDANIYRCLNKRFLTQLSSWKAVFNGRTGKYIISCFALENPGEVKVLCSKFLQEHRTRVNKMREYRIKRAIHSVALWLFPPFTQSLLSNPNCLHVNARCAGLYFFFCYKSASEGVFSGGLWEAFEMRHKNLFGTVE